MLLVQTSCVPRFVVAPGSDKPALSNHRQNATSPGSEAAAADFADFAAAAAAAADSAAAGSGGDAGTREVEQLGPSGDGS